VEDSVPAPAAHEFYPGEFVYGSFLVSGYKKRVEAGDREFVSLSHRIEALDPAGVLIGPIVEETTDVELAPQDKEWMPKIRFTFTVPPLAPSADYRVRIASKDNNSGQQAAQELTFHVKGLDVEPSDTLTIRDFGFVRQETDRLPLSTPAFRPGDTVWAKFYMTGYELGDNNLYNLSYGLAVLSPDGEVLFEQPDAATLTEEPFYPKRVIPGTASVQAPEGIALGGYKLRIAVRDLISGQEYQTAHDFTIE
jgi:hypothetical protein